MQSISPRRTSTSGQRTFSQNSIVSSSQEPRRHDSRKYKPTHEGQGQSGQSGHCGRRGSCATPRAEVLSLRGPRPKPSRYDSHKQSLWRIQQQYQQLTQGPYGCYFYLSKSTLGAQSSIKMQMLIAHTVREYLRRVFHRIRQQLYHVLWSCVAGQWERRRYMLYDHWNGGWGPVQPLSLIGFSHISADLQCLVLADSQLRDLILSSWDAERHLGCPLPVREPLCIRIFFCQKYAICPGFASSLHPQLKLVECRH